MLGHAHRHALVVHLGQHRRRRQRHRRRPGEIRPGQLVLLAREAGDLRTLGVEDLTQRQVERRNRRPVRPAEVRDRPGAGLADLRLGRALGHIGQERQRRLVSLDPQHLGDELLPRPGLRPQRHTQRHHRLRAHLHQNLLRDRLQLRVRRIDQRFEQLRHRILTRREKPLGRQVASLKLPGQQVDVPLDLLWRAGPLQLAALKQPLEVRRRRFQRAADIATHRLADRLPEPLQLTAALNQVGKRLRRHIAVEQLLTDQLSRVGAVDQHIVNEVPQLLLRRGGIIRLRHRRARGGQKRERGSHDRENTTTRRSTHG